MIGDYFTDVGISKLRHAFRKQFPNLYYERKYTITVILWCDGDYAVTLKSGNEDNYLIYYQLHKRDIYSTDADSIEFTIFNNTNDS